MTIPPEALALATAIVGGLVTALAQVYREKNKLHDKLEAALVRLDAEVKARLEAAEHRADNADEVVKATEAISARLEAAIDAITSQPEVVPKKRGPYGRPPMGSTPGR
jgi:hypothetical protein